MGSLHRFVAVWINLQSPLQPFLLHDGAVDYQLLLHLLGELVNNEHALLVRWNQLVNEVQLLIGVGCHKLLLTKLPHLLLFSCREFTKLVGSSQLLLDILFDLLNSKYFLANHKLVLFEELLLVAHFIEDLQPVELCVLLNLNQPAILLLAQLTTSLLNVLNSLLLVAHVLLNNSQLLSNLLAAPFVDPFELLDGVTFVLPEHLALTANWKLALPAVVVLYHPMLNALLV